MRVQIVVSFLLYLVRLTAVLIAILTIVSGCNEQTEPVLKLTSWENSNLYVELECPTNDQCQFVTTIAHFGERREVDLTLCVAHGIRFKDDLLPNENIILSNDGLTATIKNIVVNPQGDRIVRFPFVVDSQIALAGEYIVDASLTDSHNENLVASELQVKAFVQMVAKTPHLLPSQLEFNKQYPFINNNENALYRIQLNAQEQPREGSILVKLTAFHENYQPIVTIHSDDGIGFEKFTPLTIAARDGGSRIIDFEFGISENDHPHDGRYIFTISIQDDGNSKHHTLPVAVRINSEENTHQQQWLTNVTGLIKESTEITAVDHLMGEHGIKNHDDAARRYFQTVSTSNFTNNVNASNEHPPPTATPTLTPTPAPTPTPHTLPPAPSPSHINKAVIPASSNIILLTSQADDENIEEKQKHSDCAKWKYPVPQHKYNLSLLGAYHKYAEGKVVMDLDSFVNGFRHCNNITELIITLYAGQNYYFPNGSRP